MQIPTMEKCYKLIYETNMLDSIVAHSIQVWRVAVLISDQLRAAGLNLDRNLVYASALLHDITKTRSISTGENHGRTGMEMLTKCGYPEVGSIIGQHIMLDKYSNSIPVTEAEIVNYSDKRVCGDKIKSLDTRMEYMLETYGKTRDRRQRILAFWKKSGELESKIFCNLPFGPDRLAEKLVNLSC